MNANSKQGISDILSNTSKELKYKLIGHTGSHKTKREVIDEVNDILNRIVVLKSKLDSPRDENYRYQEGQKAGESIEYRINSDGGALAIQS